MIYLSFYSFEVKCAWGWYTRAFFCFLFFIF